MSTKPYVSFVTWARNDGYTKDYLQRVTRATTFLANQLERAHVRAEIVITEWNPPSGSALLSEALKVPSHLDHVSIRSFVVDQKFHTGFAGSDERPLHNSEAINVGLRRARGRFLTPKASDTFFSPQAIERLARQDLNPDVVYRMDRWDVAIGDSSIWNKDDDTLQAEFRRLPSQQHTLINQMKYWRLRDLHTNACGDFMLMAAAYWHVVRGFPRDKTVLSLNSNSLTLHAAVAHGISECRWPGDCRVLKPSHDNLNSARLVPVFKPWQRSLDEFVRIRLGVEAMHWIRTRLNYPRRRVRGVNSVLGELIEKNFVLPASRWARGEYFVPTQPQNWGLADERLEERVLCRAGWEHDAAAMPS